MVAVFKKKKKEEAMHLTLYGMASWKVWQIGWSFRDMEELIWEGLWLNYMSGQLSEYF